ncbi:MAG: hypothetical protein SGI92_33390 [Bryobacteraceae bacterium]|nr:hypothetical protein [Bryobacteraceae bacterium]
MKSVFAFFLLTLPALFAAAGPVVSYSKSFPGSVPAYVSITVQKDGGAVYKEAVDDEEPVAFKVAPEDVQMIYGLAETLDYFQKPLESGLKVAQMGKKTFGWQDGAAKHETTFNFSLDENAKTLLDWFERVTETQQLYFALERSVRFDKLGVNKSILQVEAAWDRKRLVSPERFLPLLDRVAKNDSYLHMARERAASLADVFRNPKPKPAGE